MVCRKCDCVAIGGRLRVCKSGSIEDDSSREHDLPCRN